MRNSTGLRFMCRIFLLLLTVFLCDSGAAVSESPHFLEARQRYENKEYLLAMLAAEKAVQEDGENPGHRYLYGAVLAELKQFSDAEAHLRKAVTLDARNAEYLYQLGRVLLEQSQQAVIRRGVSAGVRMSRSEAVDAEGLALLERAVKLDGDLLAARVRLGRAYTDQNRFLETLEQSRAVAEADPHYPEIHSYLAVLYLKMGRVIQAIQALQTEVEFYPDNAMARLDLGDLLLQLAQPRLALRHLLAAEQKSPETPDLHYALAKTYRALDQPGKALASARKCVDLAPEAPAPRYLLAQLHRRSGQSELARRELATAERLRNRQSATYRPPKAD
ncbi:MAG: tetratricopeptide repeat protein [Acidobacteria bacterium]|nr:tetratricopeptide repeat protein [Acidobacteriota bacterium]